MIKDRNDIGTRPPLHSTNQTWNCQFMKNWRYHRTNGQNWKKDPKFHRHKRWTRLRHPRSWRTRRQHCLSPDKPSISASCLRVQFLPTTSVSLLCGPGISVSVSQCRSRGDTLRAACAVKNIISYSWCYKLQIAIKYIYSLESTLCDACCCKYCLVKMSRCSTRTSKDARTELVGSCVNSLIECLNGK